MMAMFQVNNIHQSYGKKHVLRGIDFHASEGEVIGDMGKNGAGNSTFLKTLMTLRTFEAGDVSLFGKDLNTLTAGELTKLRQDISVVLQPAQVILQCK